jgi:hypothetical protein
MPDVFEFLEVSQRFSQIRGVWVDAAKQEVNKLFKPILDGNIHESGEILDRLVPPKASELKEFLPNPKILIKKVVEYLCDSRRYCFGSLVENKSSKDGTVCPALLSLNEPSILKIYGFYRPARDCYSLLWCMKPSERLFLGLLELA